jgi:hypothetical protein
VKMTRAHALSSRGPELGKDFSKRCHWGDARLIGQAAHQPQGRCGEALARGTHGREFSAKGPLIVSPPLDVQEIEERHAGPQLPAAERKNLRRSGAFCAIANATHIAQRAKGTQLFYECYPPGPLPFFRGRPRITEPRSAFNSASVCA